MVVVQVVVENIGEEEADLLICHQGVHIIMSKDDNSCNLLLIQDNLKDQGSLEGKLVVRGQEEGVYKMFNALIVRGLGIQSHTVGFKIKMLI